MIPIHYAQHVSEATVYIAGKWEARARLRGMASALRAGGYHVTSSWLDRSDEAGYGIADPTEAPLDLDEIDQSNILILDTLDENPTGGANVEFGYAMAYSVDRLLIVVGPYRNIFHPLAAIHFENWLEALETLLHPHVLYGVCVDGT